MTLNNFYLQKSLKNTEFRICVYVMYIHSYVFILHKYMIFIHSMNKIKILLYSLNINRAYYIYVNETYVIYKTMNKCHTIDYSKNKMFIRFHCR